MCNQHGRPRGGPRTRMSSQAHGSLSTEMLKLIQKEMSNYLKSSNFKEIVAKAVKVAIREEIATVMLPLRDEITALKQLNHEENCQDVVTKFFCHKLDMSINPNKIDWVHRVGCHREHGITRPMIVKFKSYNGKATVIKKKRILHGRRIYII